MIFIFIITFCLKLSKYIRVAVYAPRTVKEISRKPRRLKMYVQFSWKILFPVGRESLLHVYNLHFLSRLFSKIFYAQFNGCILIHIGEMSRGFYSHWVYPWIIINKVTSQYSSARTVILNGEGNAIHWRCFSASDSQKRERMCFIGWEIQKFPHTLKPYTVRILHCPKNRNLELFIYFSFTSWTLFYKCCSNQFSIVSLALNSVSIIVLSTFHVSSMKIVLSL